MLDLVGKRRLASHAPASCNIYHERTDEFFNSTMTTPSYLCSQARYATSARFLYSPYAFTILSPTPSPDQ